MEMNMKKIVLLVALVLWTAAAYGQYVPEWHQGDLQKKGARIAVQGEKLDPETTLQLVTQVGGEEMAASWEKYAKKRGWGVGLTSAGYTVAAAGLAYGGVYLFAAIIGSVFAAIGGQEAVDSVWDNMGPRVSIGTGVMVAGLAAGTTGVVLLCSGNRHLKEIVQACDAAGLPADAELTFGPAPSGVGLVLRF